MSTTKFERTSPNEVQMACANCGRALFLYPSQARHGDLRFCDRDCHGAYRSKKWQALKDTQRPTPEKGSFFFNDDILNVLGASRRGARALFLSALFSCATQRTGGYISCAALTDIRSDESFVDANKAISFLVDEGYWLPDERGGYRIARYENFIVESAA